MNPEPDPVESLFAVVLGKAADERAAYLDQACAGDATLRQRVEALLRAHAEASGEAFLTGPYQRGTAAQAPAEGAGTRIGPYKLLQQIGEGGMGVVYMAEQEQPVRRRVALKIIKPGMDSAQVIARFEAERQALAMMDHQNIARVLDAGTTPAGRPYFVMELVHGVPITRFCDDNRLTPRQRLELFVPVCQAIQHAHQKGIIHRDVKPSNVLVTLYDDKPVPKVIDFGVAKAIEQRLTEKTLFTQYGTLVGTFEYMSPEQAEMNAFGVDTRSDVYSLGVLLYELLTGTTPLERKRLREAALDEVVRLIREEEPPRPSARLSSSGNLPKIAAERKMEPGRLALLVRGELDWIVMRCLEKNRSRRYETVSALARDVERYLRDEPVEACPPSAGYRLRKFARKNRVVLTTATAFAALLLTAAVVSTWLAVQAKKAEAVADEKREAADVAQQKEADERNRANQEAVQAKANAAETRRALNRMTVAKGIQLADEGNLFAALPWFVKPLERGGLTAEEETMHRTRIACYLRYTPGRPRLRHMLFCDKPFGAKGAIGEQRLRMAFSADGKRLLAICGEIVRDLVHIWDVQRGTLIATLKHPDGVNKAQFSLDGTRVLTASEEATVWMWDAASGRALGSPFMDLGGMLQRPQALLPMSPWQFLGSASAQRWEDHKWPMGPYSSNAVATEISRDGRRVLFTFKYGQRLLDLETHKLVGQWPYSLVYALSPDGRYLLQADGNLVRVHDTTAGKTPSRSIDHGSPVRFVGFSSDGSRVLTVGQDESAQVWDARIWLPLTRIRLTGSPGKYRSNWELSPDYRWIAGWCVGIGNLALWDVESGRLVREVSEVKDDLTRINWRPDGQQFLLSSYASNGDLTLWDAVSDWKKGLVLPHFGEEETVYAPNGRTFATAGEDGEVRIWDLCDREGAFIWQVPENDEFDTSIRMRSHVTRYWWNVDSKRMFGVKTVTGTKEFAWLDPQHYLPPRISFNAGTLSPDHSRAITCHDNFPGTMGGLGSQILKLWDANTRQAVGKPLALEEGYNYNYVVFSPNSSLFAAASNDGVTRLYNSRTGESVGKPLKHDRPVLFASFSPDGELLATCSEDRTARLWRTKDGEPIGESLRHADWVTCAAFAPNGKTLATASLDGPVRLWEVGRRTPAGVLKLKMGHARDLVFHPNGSLLMVSFADQEAGSSNSSGKIKLFDITSLQEVSPTVKGVENWDHLQFRFGKDSRFVFGFFDQRTWNLTPDNRSVSDLTKLGQLYSGRRLDTTGDESPLSKQELQALWLELHAKHPAEFAVSPQAAVQWRIKHLQSINTIERPFECAFHRRWLAAELSEAGWQPGERGNEDLLRTDYLHRLQALALHGRQAEATAAADALAARWPKDHESLYQCACVHALAAETDKSDAILADRYAVRAVALLRQAADAGYKDAQTPRKDQDLDALRGREDFKDLLKTRFPSKN